MKTHTHAKTDICERITNGVVASLEKGVAPWRCPMEQGGGKVAIPENAETGAQYRGMNVLMLLISGLSNHYHSNRWMTYKQAQAAGGQVRKGEKSTPGVFYKTLEKGTGECDADGNDIVDHIPMIRGFSLFNLDQTEDLDRLREDAAPRQRFTSTPVEAGERLLTAAGLPIHIGGTEAYYVPATDSITLPDRDRFQRAEDFYAAFAHELSHATGHATRCNRTPYKSDDAKAKYAFEELVAELSACFVCAHLGLPQPIDNHANYIGGWLHALKNDKRFLFRAAAQAQVATDWILGRVAAADTNTQELAA